MQGSREYLNTSHVKVQPRGLIRIGKVQLYLNTSHVKVQLF